MNRFSLRINILIVLIATLAQAEEAPVNLQTSPIIGVVQKMSASMNPKFDNNYCWLEGSAIAVPEKTGLVVTGISECKPRYGSGKTFYEVAYRGKRYYTDTSEISVKDEDLARLNNFTGEESLNYKKIALYATKKYWLDDVKTSFKRLQGTSKYGIAILTSSIYDISEYTDGTGFRITYYNPTKKTIKYITANFVGYNSVGDPVKDYRSRSSQITLRGVGPIEPDSSATYSRDYAWMTDLVESFKITSIKIQYMDGSIKTVKDPKKVWIDKGTYEILNDFHSESPTTDAADAPAAAPVAAPAAR